MLVEILLVAGLTILNGLLAMSELAVASSRPIRLKVLAGKKTPGAETALRLSADPGRFLSTVQIGITLVGVLNGALSGATIGRRLGDWLVGMGVDPAFAEPAGVGSVVVLITYFTLIIGELVPKQIALRNPERVASLVAPAMHVLSVVTTPVVWLLDISGRLVLLALGQHGGTVETVTEEEVRGLIAEAETAGVLETDERLLMTGVMRLADRSAQGLMTPRRDVEFIDLADGFDAIRQQLLSARRSRLPVRDGEPDSIIGVVLVREAVAALVEGGEFDIRQFVHEAPVVLDQVDALSVLRAIRSSIVHLALVYDEYGHFEGIVTSGDVLESIAGAFREEGDEGPSITERADGSYLVEGWMPVDEFAEHIGLVVARDVDYETVAGLVLSELKRLPRAGESVAIGDLDFEVVDLDGRRIDKVLVTRRPAEAGAEKGGSGPEEPSGSAP